MSVKYYPIIVTHSVQKVEYIINYLGRYINYGGGGLISWQRGAIKDAECGSGAVVNVIIAIADSGGPE